jgi:small subunit ribosomal protein S20
MAHSRTAKKAIRQNERRRLRNKAANSAMRTQLKKLHEVVAEGDTAAAPAELAKAQKALDKAAKTDRIHPNKAARIKSRLAKKVGGIGSDG